MRQQQYSFTLISAVSKDEVVANQLIEGGVDSSVYEHFTRKLLESVHMQEKHRNKRVVLLMDNAVIHHHQQVVDTVLKFHAILLFNVPYSP